MLLPGIFGENLFDNFMEDFGFPSFPDVERKLYGQTGKNLMRTDVKETDNSYVVDIDLPGFKKEELSMNLEKGYLTVSAAKGLEKGGKNETDKYVRRERYSGSMSRSFYVGENITENDIHPKYENGILTFTLPKAPQKPVEEKKFIAIEG